MSKELKIEFLKCSIKENQLTIKDLFSQEEIDAFFVEHVKLHVEKEKKSFSNTLSEKFTSFIDEVLGGKKEEVLEKPKDFSKPATFVVNGDGVAFLDQEKIGIQQGNLVWAKGYLADGKTMSKSEALDLIAKLPKINGKSWRLPTDADCSRLCSSLRSNGSEAGGGMGRDVRDRFVSIGGDMHSGSHLTRDGDVCEGRVKVVLYL